MFWFGRHASGAPVTARKARDTHERADYRFAREKNIFAREKNS